MSEEQNQTGATPEKASESPPAATDVKQKWADRLKSLWANRSSPGVYLPAGGVLLLAAGLSAFVFFRPDYRIKGDLPWLAGVVPIEQTSLYIEAKEPARLYELWRDSAAGSKIVGTPAWQALRDGQLSGLQTILYLLELKAGFAFENPFDYFKESVGVALSGEHVLLVARTDLTSRAGVALVKSLRGKTIYLPGETLVDEKGNRKQPKKPEQKNEEEQTSGARHVPESLPVLVERREKLNNLELTVLQSGARKYFLVLVDEYLFVSDHLDLLRESLGLATGLSSDSLGAAEGMVGARESLARGDGRVLLYVNANGDSLLAPAAALVGGEQGFAAVMRADQDETISFDTFSVGEAAHTQAQPGRAADGWSDAFAYFPGDAALTLLFRDQSPADLLAVLEDGEGATAEVGKSFEQFIKGGGGTLDDFKPGVGLALLGFEQNQKRLLPRVVAGVRGDEETVATLRRIVFRKTGEERREFQNVSYLVADRGKYYRPARAYFGKGDGAAPGFLATDEESLRSVLNARQGNRADLSDLKTLGSLGDFREAPVQIVIDLSAARSALREFYMLGARRGRSYTEKTIERDIDPLFAPLASYRTLHLAHGLAGPVHGRVVMSAAEQ